MTEAEAESLAKRYIAYMGLRIKKRQNRVKMDIGDFMFTSYTTFLFGEPEIELSYNDLANMCSGMKLKTLEYSSAEELDFKLSAMGF